jgi:hypothetical protein
MRITLGKLEKAVLEYYQLGKKYGYLECLMNKSIGSWYYIQA